LKYKTPHAIHLGTYEHGSVGLIFTSEHGSVGLIFTSEHTSPTLEHTFVLLEGV
jgi:hypothetical protein